MLAVDVIGGIAGLLNAGTVPIALIMERYASMESV
jgi:hypothetical protein